MKRFNHEFHPNRAYNQSLMMPAKDGDYVLYSDVAPLVEALRRMIANKEQSAFEDWMEKYSPSGDVECVQRQWIDSAEYEWLGDDFDETKAALSNLDAKERGV